MTTTEHRTILSSHRTRRACRATAPSSDELLPPSAVSSRSGRPSMLACHLLPIFFVMTLAVMTLKLWVPRKHTSTAISLPTHAKFLFSFYQRWSAPWQVAFPADTLLLQQATPTSPSASFFFKRRFTSRRAAPSSRRITRLAARAAHQLPLRVRLLVVQVFASSASSSGRSSSRC